MNLIPPIAICHRCPRKRRIDARTVVCSLDGRDIIEHAEARACTENRFANATGTPIRGAGDVVSLITSTLRIQPCDGCDGRQDDLNRLLPRQRVE